jgi:hypothetical protein
MRHLSTAENLPRTERGATRRLPKGGRALSAIFRADPDGRDPGRRGESLEQRCAARRARIVVHRAKDHADADQWDLEFWQNQTPEMRLLALVELGKDLGKVRGRNRMFDDE